MGKNSKIWDQVNKNSDDIKEILKQVEISDPEKDTDKFLTKHKDIIQIGISLATLITTIIIATCITKQQLELSKEQKQISDTQLEISKSNKILTENNQNLIYDTQISLGNIDKSSRIVATENLTEIKFDFKVTPKKVQGNIKSVYAYIHDNELETLTHLNVSTVNEVNANYSIKGNGEQFKNTVLDMYILYVDYKNNIYYDYVFFIPKYTEHHVSQYSKDADGNEINDTTVGLVLMELEYKIISQYEAISKKDYTTIVENYKHFDFTSHDDVLKNVTQIKTYIKQNLI